jgi:hypothetical protein
MAYDQLHTFRSFFDRLFGSLCENPKGPLAHARGSVDSSRYRAATVRESVSTQAVSAPGRKGALLVLSAALLSSIASGQVPTTTALPYLLTDQANIIRVVASDTVTQVPPAVNSSGFSSLLGGGFSSLLASPTASVASAVATASIRSLLLLKKANALQTNFNKMKQDADNEVKYEQNVDPEAFCAEDEFTPVKFNHQLKVPLKARMKARVKGAHPADSPTCMLPEEQEALEAEEELESVMESEAATQEAIEGAEAAAEAAEAAAEAAETAVEATLDAFDVVESLLDALVLL